MCETKITAFKTLRLLIKIYVCLDGRFCNANGSNCKWDESATYASKNASKSVVTKPENDTLKS